MMKRIRTRSSRKQLGAATIEYALVIAAVVAISAAVLGGSAGDTGTLFEKITTKVSTLSF